MLSDPFRRGTLLSGARRPQHFGKGWMISSTLSTLRDFNNKDATTIISWLPRCKKKKRTKKKKKHCCRSQPQIPSVSMILVDSMFRPWNRQAWRGVPPCPPSDHESNIYKFDQERYMKLFLNVSVARSCNLSNIGSWIEKCTKLTSGVHTAFCLVCTSCQSGLQYLNPADRSKLRMFFNSSRLNDCKSLWHIPMCQSDFQDIGPTDWTKIFFNPLGYATINHCDTGAYRQHVMCISPGQIWNTSLRSAVPPSENVVQENAWS